MSINSKPMSVCKFLQQSALIKPKAKIQQKNYPELHIDFTTKKS